MARVKYSEALKDDTLTIVDKFLVIDTIQDGYFNIYKGTHPFRVIKIGEDFGVFPVYWSETEEGKTVLSNEPYPIIRTVGEDVFFVKRTLNDPYNGPELSAVQGSSKKIAHKVLDAFNVFAQSEFNLGVPNPIHIFIGDEEEIGLMDDVVEFVQRDEKGNIVEVEEPVP